MCVCVCVCVCVYVNEIWGSLVPAAEQNLFWWIQRRKTWKEDRICHMKQLLSWISSSFCVFIPSSSLRSHLASPVGLGWFPVTTSDWPTTRSKSCLRTPTPGTSPFPFTSVSADSQAHIFSVRLLASWPSFFFFIFKLYIIVLVLPNIKMNPPQVYICSPPWTLLPPPSPYHPSGLSHCTKQLSFPLS